MQIATQSRPQLLDDVLTYLFDLAQEGVRPAEAQRRLQEVHRRHPHTRLDLVWEEEAYNAAVHYDTLLHLPGEGTVSLSFCADQALPWPLRGVHRWDEGDLVRVNNTVLSVDQAIATLDFIWDEARLIERLINLCLIQEALEQAPVELSDAELQLAMDGFRRARRLYTVDETLAWMARHGLSHEQFEVYVADQAMVAALRSRVAAAGVEPYFARHHSDFDTVILVRCDYDDEASARQAGDAIRRGETDFYVAAEARLLAGGTPLFSRQRRHQIDEPLAGAIVAGGELLGPLSLESGYTLVHVLAVTPASLDEETRRQIEEILFDAWLQERRQAADIEWYWGNAARTNAVRTSLDT